MSVYPLVLLTEAMHTALHVTGRFVHVISVAVNGAIYATTFTYARSLYLYFGALIVLFYAAFLGSVSTPNHHKSCFPQWYL
jgi:hypothetical protein